MVEANQSEDIEFKWLKKRGVGGKKKEVQFYESFRFDGVDYCLYDSVHLYKEGDPEPYIGKLIKIWEHVADKTKKVKVLWFFRPCEIQNYLGAEVVRENELFLASGEGAGLANLNPLEAIAGKCNVICISTDERNRKPVDEELHMAEFVFHRTFDVGQQKISHKIDEKIAGIEAKLLLNKAEIYKFDGITKESANNNEGKKEGGETTVLRDSATPPSRIVTCDERIESKEKSKDEGLSTKKDSLDLPLVKDKSALDKASSEPVANVGEMDGQVKRSRGFVAGDEPLKRPKFDDKLSKKEDKNYKDSSLANTCTMNKSNEEKDKNHLQSSGANINRLEKVSRQTIGVQKDKSKLPNKSQWPDKDPCNPKAEEKSSLSNTMLKRSAQSSIDGDTVDYKVIEVTRRPNLDKKTWFKKLPFEEGMESAYRRGTLVLLRNLDPSYTSSEVEDIIWHAFNEDCTAKMIQHTAISSRHSGQAFVIFKTREAAEKALRKLDDGCLLLSNGRPLVASMADPIFISKQPTFHGHLVFNNPRLPPSREMKEAVSTSHCSQANTIEYEMAMEWCLLHDREDYAWEHLHKGQGDDLRKLKADLKWK